MAELFNQYGTPTKEALPATSDIDVGHVPEIDESRLKSQCLKVYKRLQSPPVPVTSQDLNALAINHTAQVSNIRRFLFPHGKTVKCTRDESIGRGVFVYEITRINPRLIRMDPECPGCGAEHHEWKENAYSCGTVYKTEKGKTKNKRDEYVQSKKCVIKQRENLLDAIRHIGGRAWFGDDLEFYCKSVLQQINKSWESITRKESSYEKGNTDVDIDSDRSDDDDRGIHVGSQNDA